MITITAPTSNIGRRVVTDLLAAGEQLRLIARDPSRLANDVRDRVEIVTGSHADADVLSTGIDGAVAVFWLVPSDPHADNPHESYVDFSRPAARLFADRPELHVVGITATGRGTPVQNQAGYVTASLEMDDLIAGTGVNYRAVACPSLMDNVARQATVIRDQGAWFDVLDADLSLPTVATRDAGATSARLLRDRSWTGFAEVAVLGPENLTQNEMASIASDVLGRPVRYQQITPTAERDQLLGYGFTAGMASGLVDMMVAKNNGLDLGVERTAENTTPTTFRQWCEDVLKPAVAG